MKYTLTFGYINKVAPNIAEIIMDEQSTISVEQYYEYREFIENHFIQPYAVLINCVNKSDFDEEVLSHIVKSNALCALASINYNKENIRVSNEFINLVKGNNFSMKTFSAFELGRAKAIEWLQLELLKNKENV